MKKPTLKSFTIEKNHCLDRDVTAYYRTDYLGFKEPSNPDYINILKNTYDNNSNNNIQKLDKAIGELSDNLSKEIMYVIKKISSTETVSICVVPRAKAESRYSDNQLLFRQVISLNVDLLIKENHNDIPSLINGSNWIARHTDTKTTHLSRETPNFDNNGDEPYKGIANNTCNFSEEIQNKHILLIDDVYTKTTNVDEDFLQALLDKGCKSITFFAIAKTKHENSLDPASIKDLFSNLRS